MATRRCTNALSRLVPAALAASLLLWACVASPDSGPEEPKGLVRSLAGIQLVREDFEARSGVKGGHVLEEADGNRFLRTSPGYASFAPVGGEGDLLENLSLSFRSRANVLAPDGPLGVALRDDGAGNRVELSTGRSGLTATLVQRGKRTALERFPLPAGTDLKTWTSFTARCAGTVLEATLNGVPFSWQLPASWAGHARFDLSPSADLDDLSVDSLDLGPDAALDMGKGKPGEPWLMPALKAFNSRGSALPEGVAWLSSSITVDAGAEADLKPAEGMEERQYMSVLPAGGAFAWQADFLATGDKAPWLVLGVGLATEDSGWRFHAGPEGLELSYGDSKGSRVRVASRPDLRTAAGGTEAARLGFARLKGDGYFLFNGQVAFRIPGIAGAEGRVSFGALAKGGLPKLSALSLEGAPASIPDAAPSSYDPDSPEETQPFMVPEKASILLAGWQGESSPGSVAAVSVGRDGGREALTLAATLKAGPAGRWAALALPSRADLRSFGGLEFSVRASASTWVRVELSSPYAGDLSRRVNAYLAAGPEWRRVFLPFSQAAFSGDEGFSFSRVSMVRVFLEDGTLPSKASLWLSDLRLAPRALAARLERERVLVDFEEGSDSRAFPLSGAFLDKADSRDASAQARSGGAGAGSSSLVVKYDKRGQGQSFYYGIPGVADLSDRDGVSFMVRGEGVTKASVGFSSRALASPEALPSTETYDLAVPVNPRWVRWRVPFSPGAVDSGSGGLVSAHVPNAARLTELFVHGYRSTYPDKGTLFVDELAAYESEEPGREILIGLPPATDAGGAASLLRTVSDTLALNLERVPGLKLMALGAEDPKAAAEKAGCSYYLEIICSAKDGTFEGKATLVQTLGSGRSKPAPFTSPVDVDLFDALDRLSESVVNALVGVDLGYEARTERSSGYASFKDPIASMSDYWLAYGSVARAPVDGRLRVGASGLVLLDAYQDGLSLLAVEVTINEGTVCLYWDYRGVDFWRRLELDPGRGVARLRSAWDLEEVKLPAGTLAVGKPLRLEVELGADATVVRLGAKVLARFRPAPRPLGRAGFGLDGAGDAWFSNFESKRVLDIALDGRKDLVMADGVIILAD